MSNRKNQNRRTIVILEALFPNCFTTKRVVKKPLKIGIKDDLLKELPAINPKVLERALTFYTSTADYLLGFELGATRVDLLGVAAGKITTLDVEHAQQRLAKIPGTWVEDERRFFAKQQKQKHSKRSKKRQRP